MSRNLVVFCDGTANEFGENNTNVVRALQVLVRDDDTQRVHYDPGVGTLPGPGVVTRLGKLISKVIDLAFATSLEQNAGEAYTYLMDEYEPGDRIYLFGFSRGAYTARLVAALLHHIGLLPRGSENLIPYALRLLRMGKKDTRGIGDDFRRTFSRPIAGDAERRCPVHFIGVWDTVSSVGWFWNQAKYSFTATNPGIRTIRHAIAIDERRAFYRQNRYYHAMPAQDLQQLWFAGVHSDVGGGYADSKLGRCSFDWMIAEAQKAGLHIDPVRLAQVAPPLPKPYLEKKHNSMKGFWPLAEFFPKWHWSSETKRKGLHLNLFRPRKILDGELLHQSALLRIREDATYKPANLTPEFRQSVQGLPTVPDTLPYRKMA